MARNLQGSDRVVEAEVVAAVEEGGVHTAILQAAGTELACDNHGNGEDHGSTSAEAEAGVHCTVSANIH